MFDLSHVLSSYSGHIDCHAAICESVTAGTSALESKAICGDLLYDLLWSDPTESDHITGCPPNPHRASVFYGPDRVKAFLQDNHIGGPDGHGMLVRAHEVTMDGFDLHTGGRCVTVFSATNYCGCTQNTGAVLEVFWDMTPGVNQLLVQAKLIGYEVQSAESLAQAWHAVDECRPPTPPRRTELVQVSAGEDDPMHGAASLDDSQVGFNFSFNSARPVTPVRRSHSSDNLCAVGSAVLPEQDGSSSEDDCAELVLEPDYRHNPFDDNVASIAGRNTAHGNTGTSSGTKGRSRSNSPSREPVPPVPRWR